MEIVPNMVLGSFWQSIADLLLTKTIRFAIIESQRGRLPNWLRMEFVPATGRIGVGFDFLNPTRKDPLSAS
jgi:hypothetical protein